MKKLLLLSSVTLIVAVANAAFSTYQNAVKEAVKSVEAQDYPAARKSFEAAQAAAKTPKEKMDAMLNVGISYEKEQNHLKAREIWGQILTMKEASEEQKLAAQSGIGGSYLTEKRFTEARAELSKVLSSPAANAGVLIAARIAIAGSYKNEGNLDTAREEFAKIATDTKVAAPIRFMAQQELGEIPFSQGKFAEARVEFTKSAQIEGINILQKAGSQARVLDTYRREGNQEQVDALLAQFQLPLFKRAEALSKEKKYAQSRSYYGAALIVGGERQNPAFAAVFRVKVANTYIDERNIEQARKELRGAQEFVAQFNGRKLAPNITSGLQIAKELIQLSTAISYYAEGQKGRAKEEYQKVLQMPNLSAGVRSVAEKDLATLS